MLMLMLMLMLLRQPHAAQPHDTQPLLGTLAAVREAAVVHVSGVGLSYEHNASPLPLYERLKLRHGAAPRLHPQRYADEAAPSRRRALQQAEGGDGELTVGNTEELRVFVDYSGFYEAGEERPPTVKGAAQPFSTCFRAGDWFMWNFPPCYAGADGSCRPPCAGPNHGGSWPEGWQGDMSYAEYVSTGQDPCGLNDVFGPGNEDGVLCNREYDSVAQNCWGLCVEEDVLQREAEEGCTLTHHYRTDRSGNRELVEHTVGQGGWTESTCNARDWAMEVIDQDIREIERYFRVRSLDLAGGGTLRLQRDEGLFSEIYALRGRSTAPECAKDARRMYRLPVSDVYCDLGQAAHTLFFPIHGQYIPGVAGWGGSAGSDATGRPIVLAMGLTVPRTAAERARYDHRAIVLHEVVHGLGFGIQNFQDTFNADGTRKQIVQMIEIDDPGANHPGVPPGKDEIWFVVSERSLDAARTYFNCSTLGDGSNPAFPGLPLMGENQLGASSRGSHWETRIMNDEFMAYGEGSSISAITLAIMEDMGHYLANYSNAQCMTWGRNRGCDFLESRCSTGTSGDDLSIMIDPRDPARLGSGVALPRSGVDVCEGHGFRESECLALGCCEWSAATAAGGITVGQCVSSVGGAGCTGSPTDPRAYERPYIKSWAGKEQLTASRVDTWAGADGGVRNSIIGRFCTHPDCGSRTHCSNTNEPPCIVELCNRYDVQGECLEPISSTRDWNAIGDGTRLNAECVDTNYISSSAFLLAQLECSAAPPGSPMMAGRDRSRSSPGFMDLSRKAQFFVTLAIIMVLAFIFFACTCLKKENYRMLVVMAGLINTVTLLIGVFVFGLALYVYAKRADGSAESLWASMAGEQAVLFTIGLGILMVVWAVWGFVSIGCVRKDRNAPMAVFIFILTCVIIVQTIGAFIVFIWAKDSYSLEAKTYKSLGSAAATDGDGGEVTTTRTNIAFIDSFLDSSMNEIELYTCNTYRKCCWTQLSDTQEDAGNTSAASSGNLASCTSTHGGAAVGAAKAELQDPSSSRFCELVAGGYGQLELARGKTPVMAVCKGMEAANIFTGKDGLEGATLAQCKENFCAAGKSGYERFVTTTFDWLRENFEWVFLIGGIFGMGETTLLVVCIAIMRIGRQSASAAHKKWEAKREEMDLKRQKSAVLIRGAGPAGETPGLKDGGYAGGDTEVIGSFDPDAEWGASKIQASFRASKFQVKNSAASASFEVEGKQGETNNPTYPAYPSEDYTGSDVGGKAPPSELDWGHPAPPSESDWGAAPPTFESDWEDPSWAPSSGPPPPPTDSDWEDVGQSPPSPPPRPY